MTQRKETIVRVFSTAIVGGLLLIIISGFSKSFDKSVNNQVPIGYCADLHLAHALVGVADATQLPDIKGLSLFLSNNLINTFLKIIADNRNVYQQFIQLQEIQSSIKPLLQRRYYHPSNSKDAEDLPILS